MVTSTIKARDRIIAKTISISIIDLPQNSQQGKEQTNQNHQTQ